MADFTGILSPSTSVSTGGNIRANSSSTPPSATSMAGQYGVFVGTLAVSVSIPTVPQPSTQTVGQLFP